LEEIYPPIYSIFAETTGCARILCLTTAGLLRIKSYASIIRVCPIRKPAKTFVLIIAFT